MADSLPPSRPFARPLKRPWYLMAALVAAWIYGARLMGDGYEQLAFFRGESPDLHAYVDAIPGAEAREAALAAGEHWVTVRESAKRREMPFGAASLLLGGVMVLFAARSMAGREGSRSALVQVVVVNAAVMIASFSLNRDVAVAEAAFTTKISEGLKPVIVSYFGTADERRRAEALTPLLSLLMRDAFSALIIIALTRPRARAFFREPEPGPLSEG
jgi:hypothetical protein